ncbi:SH3 domain-containing protein [Aetokthonos hydrillicola Thurmond2011]|uniref:SH3 domain-containing protein n=1 Tax=Aetokthonos hydrillicola Thurmond2011 TaxID=2712845 RepID=A0AAP5IB78_9CYAN|nr:SH3 domain-containing protein [Aetokthonos hydrillicola]MBW4588942.1 SH3 domain-containing protein [Aetokthonos hydrillicola CCALA 1050]MDR9898231.1 SH3 domain-containing protein [Aetokthonos hydrillicola Thurmond2011]
MFTNILKYTLGFLLAIAILAVGGLIGGLYMMNRTTILPAKPIFANDQASVKNQASKSVVVKDQVTSKPETKNQSPIPTPTPTAKPLPPGAYQARVTWQQGLVLRAQPEQDAERVGGVGFRQKVFVLEQSPDKAWQKIRLQNGDKEGWVKAGNTQQIGKNDTQEGDQ